MKSIVITKKNAKWVFSRLEKFFRHKNFLCWHQFSGGMKKRIGHIVRGGRYSDGYSFDVMRKYHNVELRYPEPKFGPGLIVDLNYDEGLLIKPGDSVAFLGNRIILKQKDGVIGTYCYQCFQILK